MLDNINAKNVPIILAPMEDITNQPFRTLCKEYGADLMFTEFIAAEALIRDAGKSKIKCLFEDSERPIGIQIFGHNPKSIVEAAIIAQEYNPDYIDINFGCPVKKVVSKGAGAALLKDPDKMVEICNLVVKSTNIPVTAKTRLGWDNNSKNIHEVVLKLQDTGIVAITIHARTRAQLYGGEADWTLIDEIKKDNEIFIPIIGNGDIKSPEDAKDKLTKYNVDGLMIGRASIGNPFIFGQIKSYFNNQTYSLPSINEKIDICLRHMQLSEEFIGEYATMHQMRKLYPHYLKGISNIKEVKMKLQTTKKLNEVKEIIINLME